MFDVRFNLVADRYFEHLK
jgi:DNA polymerase III delta prime subunit